MLSLDVRNAFNSAPWNCILRALKELNTPQYLVEIASSYLSNRTISLKINGREAEFKAERGVPQGSVLGPCLWNILYDGLLRTTLPDNVEMLAFADDVAVIATAEHNSCLPQMLESAYAIVNNWMLKNGLALAEQKTEAIVLTNRWSRNKMSVKVGETTINSSKTIKYLGLVIDQRMNFTEHAIATQAKVSNTIRQLGYILPNLGGASESRRSLLANVATSQLLYGAPCWESGMAQSGWLKLEMVHRRTAIVKVCAYKSVSYAAVTVVAGMPPIRLLAKERSERYDGLDREVSSRSLITSWQRRWSSDTKGRWTHRLIPDIERWISRKHGEVGFRLCQFLTGHGSFGSYLLKRKVRSSDESQMCGTAPDTAEHAVYECDAWHADRRIANTYLGVELSVQNTVSLMLESKDNWRRIAGLIDKVVLTREEIERTKERARLQEG